MLRLVDSTPAGDCCARRREWHWLGADPALPSIWQGKVFLGEGGNVVTEDDGLKPFKTNG